MYSLLTLQYLKKVYAFLLNIHSILGTFTYRNIALGSGTAVARIGAFFSPFIAQSVRTELLFGIIKEQT